MPQTATVTCFNVTLLPAFCKLQQKGWELS